MLCCVFIINGGITLNVYNCDILLDFRSMYI